ncbi:MAG: hypothetical protein FWG90_09460 [Oscillospiraceae bacterium]|nr:hypothetical protein [Oscillospiraceae bacterium]
MATKIDYVALIRPLQTILKSDKINSDDKIEMVLEVMAEILKQAEKES